MIRNLVIFYDRGIILTEHNYKLCIEFNELYFEPNFYILFLYRTLDKKIYLIVFSHSFEFQIKQVILNIFCFYSQSLSLLVFDLASKLLVPKVTIVIIGKIILRGPMSHRLTASGQLERNSYCRQLCKIESFYERYYLRRFPVLRRSLGRLQSPYSQVILRSLSEHLQSIYCMYGSLRSV